MPCVVELVKLLQNRFSLQERVSLLAHKHNDAEEMVQKAASGQKGKIHKLERVGRICAK